MERRQLEYFVAVTEHGGFGKASTALNVTQSAISQAIRQLEEELGTNLFVRTGREAVLTAAGHAALGPARRALHDFTTIRAAVADVRGLSGGYIDIATFPPLAEWPVGALVGAFRKRHPAVAVSIIGPAWARIPDVAALVREGKCELGFTDDTELEVASELISHLLEEQEYVAILPPHSSISENGFISLEDILERGLIVGPWWETSPPYVALRSKHLPSKISVRIEYREAYIPLIISGAGAAILPKFVGQIAAGAGAVVAKLETSIYLKTILIHRRGSLSPAAKAFLDVALEANCQEVVDSALNHEVSRV